LSGSVAETQAREAPVVARTGSKEAGRRAVTLLEGRGATPGPSRCCEFTSVVSRSRTSGKLVPLVRYLGIHRLFCDRNSEASVGRLCSLRGERNHRSAPWPEHPTACKRGDCRRGSRHGKGESFGEEARERFALPWPKGCGEHPDPVEPQERRLDEISWPGLQAE